MSEMPIGVENEDAQKKSLYAFIVDNEEFEQMEELLSQFNIFEAIGYPRITRMGANEF